MKKLEVLDALSLVKAIQDGNGVAITMLNGKRVKARSKVFFIAGLGDTIQTNNTNLILSSTVKTKGYNNFDKGTVLNAGRNVLVLAARWMFDASTSSVTPLIATWADAPPAAFQNGEWQISQDGTGVLLDSPIAPFAKNGTAISAEEQFRQVVPFLIREQVPFAIQAFLAANGTSAQAWRLELDAIEFTDADAS